MRGLTRRRLSGQAPDAGAYAILYAVLVVVLIGMGAIVVDTASVREDRRAMRSASDSAVLGAAALLDSNKTGGASPYKACQRAWDYLATTLRITNAGVPTGPNACSPFAPGGVPIVASTYCSVASPAEIDAPYTIGNRTFVVAWPIPTTGGSGFLNPDIAPGTVTQTYAPGIDGPTNSATDKGCDRVGVAIFENAKFGLASGIGFSGTETQVHSVARADPTGGPDENVAALNVLNPTECEALVKTGNGKIIVGPTLDKGVPVGPGIIAVESDASAIGGPGGCNGGKDVIAVKGGTGSICASDTSVTLCDGGGVIQSFALSGPGAVSAYDAGSGTISPTPTPTDATHGWHPVTKHYGCNTSRLPCAPPAINYIAQLEAAYGSGTPAVYSSGQAPYSTPAYPGLFTARTDICNVGTLLVIPAGNWFADCPGDISVTGTLVVAGGNLVARHGIAIGNSGCFVMNTDVTGCPTAVIGGVTVVATSGSGAEITTVVPPVHEATVFLRSGSIDNNGTLVMPQTFVYAMGASGAPLTGNATVAPLWTAPGAGALNGSGRTNLEEACYDVVVSAIDPDCMDSHFSRVAYWSDYAAPQTAPNTFNGQGNLAYVGVFFTPKAYDNFTGDTAGEAAAAQFWADKLNVNGSGTISLSPDTRFAFTIPTVLIRLIR